MAAAAHLVRDGAWSATPASARRAPRRRPSSKHVASTARVAALQHQVRGNVWFVITVADVHEHDVTTSTLTADPLDGFLTLLEHPKHDRNTYTR